MNFIAAVAVAMTVSFNANAASKKSVKKVNAPVENVAVTSADNAETRTQSYKDAKGVAHKNLYTIDAQGRVTKKVCYIMNEAGTWVPQGQCTVSYEAGSCTLSYAGYNAKTQTFTSTPDQITVNGTELPSVFFAPNK